MLLPSNIDLDPFPKHKSSNIPDQRWTIGNETCNRSGNLDLSKFDESAGISDGPFFDIKVQFHSSFYDINSVS